MEKEAAKRSVDTTARELSKKFKNKKQFWRALEGTNTVEQVVDVETSELKRAYKEMFNKKLTTMNIEIEKTIEHENRIYFENIKNNQCQQRCQLKETQTLIKNLKIRKAAGVSKINNEMFKYGGARLAILVTHIINCCLTQRYVPACISIGLMFPILKDQKKSNKDLDNTRPLTLSEPLASILEKYLLNKIENNFTEEPTQFGFRKNSSTSHAIFTLKETLIHNKSKNKPIIACFIDFSKAFDKVNRPKLFEKLRAILNQDHWALLYAYYTSTTIKIKGDRDDEPGFCTTIGVKQGGPLSPKLFALYVNDMIREVINSNTTCKIDDIETGILLYADDTVVCTNNVNDQNRALEIINNYCLKHEIMINVGKTKFMFFNESQLKRRTVRIEIGNSVVEQVTKFKYLGCWIECSLRNQEHIKSRKQSILAAATKLRKIGLNSKEMSLEVKSFLFETYCRSTIQYGLTSGYNTQGDIKELMVLDSMILKVAFGLTKYHSTSMLLSAIKVTPLDKLVKLRKLQMIMQLLRYDVTAEIITHQLTNSKQLPSKAFIKDVIGQQSLEEDLTVDWLISTISNETDKLQEEQTREQETEKAVAINYLIRHDSLRNHQIVRKMLSWENRARPINSYGRITNIGRRLG